MALVRFRLRLARVHIIVDNISIIIISNSKPTIEYVDNDREQRKEDGLQCHAELQTDIAFHRLRPETQVLPCAELNVYTGKLRLTNAAEWMTC